MNAIGVSSGPMYEGARLFYKGVKRVTPSGEQGGHRGPDLTTVADRLTDEQLKMRMLNGDANMPAFGSILKLQERDLLLASLESRSSNKNGQTTG